MSSKREVEESPDSRKILPVRVIESECIPMVNPTESRPETEEKSFEEKKVEAEFKEFEPSLFTLFYFTSKNDKILTGFALLFSIGQGIILPFIALTVGDLTNSLATEDITTLVNEISSKFLTMIYVGIGIFVAGYIAAFLWNILSARQTATVKRIYFRKLLRMNVPWFDKQVLNELPANYADQINDFSSSLSIKMHLYFMHLAIVFGGVLISFIKGYILTFILLALTPLMFLFMYFFIRFIQKTEKFQKKHYAKASSISNEAITYIKTVKSLNGEEHEIKRYIEECRESKKHAIKYGYMAGALFGATFFSIYIVYSFAFYVSTLMINGKWYNANTGNVYQVGDFLTIYFANLISIFALGQVSPLYKNLESGKSAVYSIIKVVSTQQEEPKGGIVRSHLKGQIEFVNVSFAYPSAPEQLVLDDVSFSIGPGEKAAFVGASGCGKSTIVQLLQRFYEPSKGKIMLDGVDLRDYNVDCLRERLGYVLQQPVLFAKSIRHNVCLGSRRGGEISDEKVWGSLEQALAKEFVENLNKQLDYYVGNMGDQLSGGQKQRVAIARIVLRKPDVWIFDEATSALDSENEALIQQAIDALTERATSISIAHRLSTIRNANKIFVMRDGRIIESGDHDQLVMINKGVYRGLYELQANRRDYKRLTLNLVEKTSVKGDLPVHQEISINLKDERGDENGNETEENEDSNDIDFKVNNSGVFQTEKTQNKSEKLEKSIKKKDKKDETKKFGLFFFLGKEKFMLILGLLASMLNGAVMPFVGYLLGSELNYFMDLQQLANGMPSSSGLGVEDTTHQIYMVIIGAVGVSVGSFIFNSLQYGIFNQIGEEFTLTLRSKYFRKLMYQDMEYFDEPKHQPIDLCNHLSDECKTVNTLIGSFIGSILQSFTSFIVGLIIAFVYSWRITLVLLGMSPFIFISGVMEALLLHQVKSKKKAGEFNLVGESLENIKVVKSLTAQEEILKEFDEECETEKKLKLKLSRITSMTIGYAQCSMFIVFALVFRIGAIFLQNSQMTKGAFLITIFSIIIGLFGAGMAAQFLGTLGSAQAAAKILLNEINKDAKIEDDPTGFYTSKINKRNLKPEFFGEIRFENVSFKYKSQKHRVFKKLNFVIPSGKSIAFAGGSGTGKTSIFALLMRFYEPQKGRITIDGVDIKDFEIKYLRSLFGVIRQDPSLFSGTIRYNITYNKKDASKEDILGVCDQANASEFIYLYDEEFERDVGSFGNNLSGGQKQRICIARVLLRKTRLLLLDEATSALDAQSELLVQAAIEKIKEGQTTITIAHRISTIKSAGLIIVLDGGKVAEMGSYKELLANNGKFVEIANLR